MIYLDNAATTRVSESAKDAYDRAVRSFGNPSSVHKIGREAKGILDDARDLVMLELNAKEGTVIFTSGGTESNNLAIGGTMLRRGIGDIVTLKTEHPSVIKVCEFLESEGAYHGIYLDVDKDGIIKIEQLRSLLKAESDCIGLVSVQAVNSETGQIQPLKEIGELCGEYEIPFHVDAVQGIGHIPLSVDKFNISFMSVSGHKLHSVKGVGALYVRDLNLLSSILVGGGQEWGYRSGTENVAGAASFADALAESMFEMRHGRRIYDVRKRFLEGLEKNMTIPYRVNVPDGAEHILSITIPCVESGGLLMALDLRDVCVSAGSACSSHDLRPSRILKAMGMSDEDTFCTIRVSFSWQNTVREADKAAQIISETAMELYEIGQEERRQKRLTDTSCMLLEEE